MGLWSDNEQTATLRLLPSPKEMKGQPKGVTSKRQQYYNIMGASYGGGYHSGCVRGGAQKKERNNAAGLRWGASWSLEGRRCPPCRLRGKGQISPSHGPLSLST